MTRTNHKAGRAEKLGAAAASQGINIPVFKLAVLVQMTWPGAPTLYYGDEAGQVGFTDPDNRRTYPWGSEDFELIGFHRDMIALHKYSPAIRKGSFKFLDCGKGFISYARFVQDEKYVIILNTSDKKLERDFIVWPSGIPMDAKLTQVMQTNELGYSIMPINHQTAEGKLSLNLGPYTGLVLKYERK
ncbi:MAG: hypothetical protein HUJ98_14745 [Bacteroidaceae bacterium]|nr:hypothetical protein [Bacteroidaceae bacterium]